MNLPDLNLFKRNFVSLVFTSSRVMMVKLNGKLDKVEVFAQKNIPPGVIMSYKVRDEAALVKTIKELWKEAKIREKFVGVVIPEFATYTKTIKLPNITDTEINEALGWQLQEFIPAPIEEIIVDWKIIGRSKTEVEILVVAMLKDVLMGYIDAVGAAGLSPLVVETPSLSIERVTSGDKEGKLIIYISKPEALLVITKGHRIIASSVVSSENINIVVSTALQMMSHYKQAEVTKVVVGGVGITQDLVQHLNYNLGKTVSFLKFEMKGISPAQAQDYLIGISLQRKNPAEPQNDLTVNLLPPGWASKYRKKLKNIQLWTLTLIVSIITWASFLSALLVFMVVSFQAEGLRREEITDLRAGFNQAVASVKTINNKATNLLKIRNNSKSFQEVINALEKLKIGGIEVRSYNVNVETGAVKIYGSSQNRTSLIDYKSAIEESEDFSNIANFPVTSLLQEANIAFEFEIKYLPFTRPAKKAPLKLKI